MFDLTPALGKRITIFAIIAGLAALVSGCGEQPSGQAGEAPQMPPVGVSVVTVVPETLPITNELPGRIAPTRIAEVRPRVSGIVIERVFQQGSLVKQGDILYRIDPAPFGLRVDSAKATLRRAEATLVQARQAADRQKELRERAVASGQQYDNAIAALAQADADVAGARAGLAAAELDLQYSEVKAPISGRIGRALITEGALVSATGTDNLATIQQLDPVYADFTQSANQLLALRRAAKAGTVGGAGEDQAAVRLFLDDGSEYRHLGRLLFSEAAVDVTTGQITLRGEFTNPDGDLLPGMYVRVQIVQGEQPNAIVVPQQAVQRDAGGQAQVYVIGAEEKAELRSISAGRAIGDRWVIDRGLKTGDRVVVEGFQTLSPGASVDAKSWRAPRAESDAAASGAASSSAKD
jgi:membrane fusion protein (multidrug efflux system)